MSLLTKISKLFSTKQTKQLIGIALQQNSILLCSFSTSELNDTVANSSIAETSTTQDHADFLFQQSKVIEGDFAQQIIKWQNDFDLAGQAHLVLNEHQTQIVQVDKPSVPEAEICAALKWQIKDLVTIAPDNMILDYFDVPTLAGSKEKVNVVCAALSDLKALVSTIIQDDIELLSITTQEFAFANLLPVQNDACLLVCQQPNEEIVLLIVKDGQLHFHRRLRGFAHLASKNEDELTASFVDNLSLEIQRSTDYYERQLKQAPIKELRMLIPMPLEGFFARKIAENTNLAVSLFNLPSPYQQHREYAAAIGACLGESKAISKEGLA